MATKVDNCRTSISENDSWYLRVLLARSLVHVHTFTSETETFRDIQIAVRTPPCSTRREPANRSPIGGNSQVERPGSPIRVFPVFPAMFPATFRSLFPVGAG